MIPIMDANPLGWVIEIGAIAAVAASFFAINGWVKRRTTRRWQAGRDSTAYGGGTYYGYGDHGVPGETSGGGGSGGCGGGSSCGGGGCGGGGCGGGGGGS